LIDEVDGRLKAWLSDLLPGVAISLDAPVDAPAGAEVSAYLWELAPAAPTGRGRRLPLQITLRYLISSRSDTPEQAHNLLGRVVFAAMEQGEYEVDLTPVPAAAWAALGVRPRPAFLLCAPLRVERQAPPAHRVLQPLVVRQVEMGTLAGQVLAAGSVPVAEAFVALLPGLELSTYTDAEGRFRLPAVPRPAGPHQLLVRAKGYEQSYAVEAAQQPLIIQFEPMEE
jgi:hypothetical protein